MTAYEGKMNMANSEDEVIRYRNLYQEAKQEYEYWKESRRKLKDLTLKETAVQGEKTIDNIKIEKIH